MTFFRHWREMDTKLREREQIGEYVWFYVLKRCISKNDKTKIFTVVVHKTNVAGEAAGTHNGRHWSSTVVGLWPARPVLSVLSRTLWWAARYHDPLPDAAATGLPSCTLWPPHPGPWQTVRHPCCCEKGIHTNIFILCYIAPNLW